MFCLESWWCPWSPLVLLKMAWRSQRSPCLYWWKPLWSLCLRYTSPCSLWWSHGDDLCTHERKTVHRVFWWPWSWMFCGRGGLDNVWRKCDGCINSHKGQINMTLTYHCSPHVTWRSIHWGAHKVTLILVKRTPTCVTWQHLKGKAAPLPPHVGSSNNPPLWQVGQHFRKALLCI